MKDLRGRNWTFVIYEESVNPLYRNILDNLHIQWCESPYHDRDIDLETGVIKKPHWHIVLCFEGNKSYDQYLDIVASVNGVPAPADTARVNSIRGIVRYLIHLDNPEKAQYERSCIIAHGGMDIQPYFQYPAEMQKRYIQEMQAYCDANCIFEYCDLLDVAARDYYDTWFDLLTVGHQSFVMTKYIDSKRNKYKQSLKED